VREVIKLKHVARIRPSNVDKKTVDGERSVRLCNYTDVYYNDVIRGNLEFMSASATPDQVREFQLRAGDVLITKDSETADDIAIPAFIAEDLPGVLCGYHLSLIRPQRDRIDPKFLFWCMSSRMVRSQAENYAAGITRVGIRSDLVGSLLVPHVPLEAERAIADYLDAETPRLDALIAKKRRMITLLHDRVQAAIDGLTVPRALGGTADAGGPAWPMVNLRYCASFFTDGDWIEAPFITTSGIRLVQTGNIGAGEFRDVGDRYISRETFRQLNCTLIHPGDVLISRLGDRVGGACLAPDIEGGMVASVDVAIMRPNSLLHPRFLVRFLSSSRHLQEAALLSRGTTISRIARSQLGSMQVPLPPMEEQVRIDRVIELEEGRYRRLEGALRHQLLLLQEHRQALITAAVTGEIDIPGVAA
jgi:type I restriction enzyme S subunit